MIKNCTENVSGHAIQQVTDVEAKAFTLGKPGTGDSKANVKDMVKDVKGWCKIKEKEKEKEKKKPAKKDKNNKKKGKK